MNQLLRFVLIVLAGLSFLVASIFIFTLSAGGATLAIALYGISALCLSTFALMNLLTDIRNELRLMTQQRAFKEIYASVEDQNAT